MIAKIKAWIKANKTIIMAILCLLIFLLISMRSCIDLRREIIQSQGNLIAARDSVKHGTVIIAGLKNSVAEKRAIILSQQQAIDAGIIERERLKALHIEDLTANAELQGIIANLQDSLKALPGTVFITVKDTTGIGRNYVRLPFQLLNVQNKYFSLSAGMDGNKLAWYRDTTRLCGTMTLGYRKDGFFKKAYPVGVFTSPDPHLTINSMDILIVQEPKKWYQKTSVHMGAGALIFESFKYILTNKF
jgi:hypothetical protein